MSSISVTGEGTPAFERIRARAAAVDWAWTAAVAALLGAALLLRVWGAHSGLPYAYNADENAHFTPKAIGLFGHGWNPHYFVNPPAFTYLLHIVFAVWFGGGTAVQQRFATDPTQVFYVARVTAAVTGVVAVWLLALTGRRLLDRRAGLLAGGLLAVAFLPVFYSHLALNDVPNLAPICLSLWGTAGVLRLGRTRDYVVAGIGLGLAAATKYTGGVVIVPLVGAVWAQHRAGGTRLAVRGLLVAGGAAVAAFVVANPYALLSFGEFTDGLNHQTSVADDAIGKLGSTQHDGYLYYLWTLTWGIGWVPALAALAAVPLLWRDERRLIWLLAPAPILFIVFMGSQTRFFGRWLIPILPFVALMGAYAVLEAADWAGRRMPRLQPTFVALAVVALCGQALVFSLHDGLVLHRPDTRNTARDWLVAHVPPVKLADGTIKAPKIVVEPVVPDSWAQDTGRPEAYSANGNRWAKFPTSRTNLNPDGSFAAGQGQLVNIEDYEKTLRPELVDFYAQHGYCWVVSGSTQSGRALVDPGQVPDAIAYYARLRQEADVVHVDSPYGKGKSPQSFNFDKSFDYYSLAYRRPGPMMTIYRLRTGQCASGATGG